MNNLLDLNKPVSIYGFGNSGKKLAKNLVKAGVKVEFFIDQRAEKNQFIENICCVRPSDINEKIEQVVIGVFNREVSPIEIEKVLRSKDVKIVIGYHEINNFFPGVVQPSFWYDPLFEISKYKDEIFETRKILSDVVSRTIFDKILKYRMTGTISDHPEGDGIDNQYFNVNIPGWLSEQKIRMLDCGAFDGDTIVSAIEHKAPIDFAFCFEPDAKNFISLTGNCRKQDKINCIAIPCATWSKTEKIFFSDPEGESSRVLTNSDNSVQAIAVDDFIANSSYKFIKVDVEGADLETLKGAINSIIRCRPYVAVGVYHCPSHLWEIAIYLNKNLKDYSFHLRQHGQFCIDTVLYCLPIKHEQK